MNNEDVFDLLQSSEQLDYSLSSITNNKFEFNLDEDIKEPSYYRNLIEVLNNEIGRAHGLNSSHSE